MTAQRIKLHIKDLNLLTLQPKLARGFQYFRRILKYPFSPLLVKSDFLILGGMKCGSTSLHYLLQKHPNVAPTVKKEVNYFSNHYHGGMNWYKTNFTSKLSFWWHKRIKKDARITGEASPLYIYHPLAAKRIAQDLPDIKLIVVFRDPVERAFSHYKHIQRRGYESLPFAEAIEREIERIAAEKEKLISGVSDYSPELIKYSYLDRGRYIEQVKEYYKYFPSDQFLFLKSEDMRADTQGSLNKVVKFLGLPAFQWPTIEQYNEGQYLERMEDDVQTKLVQYYKPLNRELSQFLGMDFNWD